MRGRPHGINSSKVSNLGSLTVWHVQDSVLESSGPASFNNIHRRMYKLVPTVDANNFVVSLHLFIMPTICFICRRGMVCISSEHALNSPPSGPNPTAVPSAALALVGWKPQRREERWATLRKAARSIPGNCAVDIAVETVLLSRQISESNKSFIIVHY